MKTSLTRAFLKKFMMALILPFISFTARSQTNVSGGIYANTTWTLAGSPYIVVDTVVVFPGVTLTIDPGVVVKFDNNKRLEIRQGSLIANGTGVDSITFTSNAGFPSPGIWNKVWLNGGTMISQFNYCNFYYATKGLEHGTDGVVIVRNSNFSSNTNGIGSSTGGNNANALIDTSNFRNNTNAGIDLCCTAGTMTVNYCNISNNTTGFYGPLDFGVVKNCVIDSNQNGLYIYQVTVDSCFIRHNQTGINGINYPNCANRILHCTIDSNVVKGVSVNNSDTVRDCQIRYNGKGIEANGSVILHNDIQYNGVNMGGFGAYMIIENIIKNSSVGIDSLDYASVISGNVIENHSVGIRVVYPWPGVSIQCNRICNNSQYDLQYLSTQNISVPNNYWCTTDSLSTTAVIYDGYDNINYGLVSFMPLDTSCYLSGCNLILTTQVINATCDTCHNGGASVYVANGFPPYTYTWLTSPIQNTQTAVGLASGTYTVCVTDGNGCTACNSNVFVDSTNCTGFSVIAVATNATCATCTDGSATATIIGGSPPYTYTWYTSPIQNTQTAAGLPQGTYVVCVGDANGCMDCDTVTVGIGSCSAQFNLYPDTVPHFYYAVNMASGVPPLSFDWNWGDASPHDTIPFPNHTYAAAGFYTICLTITDSVGCTDSLCVSYYLTRATNSMIYVNVVASLPTGINTISDDNFFSVFPNPSSDFVTINFSEAVDEAMQIKIYNALGKTVQSLAVTEQKNVIDVSKMPRGIYLIEIISTSKAGWQKFIKQ